jgi:hypothetical protein
MTACLGSRRLGKARPHAIGLGAGSEVITKGDQVRSVVRDMTGKNAAGEANPTARAGKI